MRKIIEVVAHPDYTFSLRSDDGVQGMVDVAHLAGKGIFRFWLDKTAFLSPRIEVDGELPWGDDIGLCPDALYGKVTGKRAEETGPLSAAEKAHA